MELEGMSWENKSVPPPRPTTPLAKRGILKQKHSRQEIPWSPTDADMELHHRTSQCDKCGYGMGSALTPSVSQDRAMSELVARLHAAEVAAEVEVDGLQPNRLLLTDSGSSSDKSATGVMMKRVTSATEQPTAASDPVQQHPQTDPTVAHKARRLSNPRNTRASAETSATTLPAVQSTTTPKSRFHEDVPSAARSTPTLAMSPNPVPDQCVARSSAATMATQLPTTPTALPSKHMNHHTHPKPKPRVRFRTIAKVRLGLMGLWKKPKAVDPEQ